MHTFMAMRVIQEENEASRRNEPKALNARSMVSCAQSWASSRLPII